MGVLIGSARMDENGKIAGGSAGDQTGKEVSTQAYYTHSKGWFALRAKDSTAAEKIAQCMENACANPCIGYDQNNRNTLYDKVKGKGFKCDKKSLKTNVETDCSALVRVCLGFAGIDIPDIYTGNLKSVLLSTGKFEEVTCVESKLKRGDVLVTKTKGHTVVVLSDGSNANKTSTNKTTAAAKTETTNNASENVKSGQKWLNSYYGDLFKKTFDALLEADGVYGEKTKAAAVCVWKDIVNRKYGFKLTPSNTNFLESSKEAAAKAKIAKGASGTLPMILQLILSAKGYYSGKMDAEFGNGTEAAVEAFQKARKLSVDGVVGADTWYALFN